jgi:DNA polymerase-3 subunit alpha
VTALTAHTKGQIIYQEQILQIVRDVGGFDWTNANEIRRIIAKKIGEAAFNVSMGSFVEGAARLHNMSEPQAQRIWKRLVTSGTYAFVYAHSVSYSILGLWCAWLKAHYPLQFFASSLAKSGDAEASYKLMRDALAHGIAVSPPKLGMSRRSWTADSEIGLVAGWMQIPGIGEKTSDAIEADKEEFGTFEDWGQMLSIKGIGPKTIETMETFSRAEDPFELHKTERAMAKVQKWLKGQGRIPQPTHNGEEIAAIRIEQEYGANAKASYGKGPKVVYAGVVKQRNYQDAVENRRSRTGEEAEDILATLSHPELLEYCSLRCFDTTEEEVYLRVNRFRFPEMKRTIERIRVDHDVVVAVGNRIAGFGTPVMVSKIYVIDPD